jgi:DNA repair protein RadD
VQLRPYQAEAVSRLRASYASGKRAPLFVLPTGGGKTFVFTYVGNKAVDRGNRVGILVHRQELLLQASRSLHAMGVKHGLISPMFNMNNEPVQVASVQTLLRRLKRHTIPFDLLIVDEAHHAAAGTWRKIIEHYPNAKILGVTATPIRTDGQGLSEVFDDLIVGVSMQTLIELGYLVRPVIYAPPTALDLSGVRKRGGDFDTTQLADRMDKPTITGSAVEHYKRLCPGKPAIAFCASVAHAQHVAEQFRAAGFSSLSLDGTMLDTERKAAIDGLSNGKINVLTSCDIVSEGTDIPVVEAAILLRPTQSTSLYIQQVGRALRSAPGKTQAIILDHVGNVMRHGMPEEHRDWTLDGLARPAAANDNEPPMVLKQCEKCYAVFKPSPVCPQCGHVHAARTHEIAETEGELKQVDPAEIEAMRREQRREIGKARTLEDLQKIAKQRGYSKGWAYHIFKARSQRMVSERN